MLEDPVANGELARQREMGVGNSVGEIAARLRMLRDLGAEAPVWTVWATLDADCPIERAWTFFVDVTGR